MARKSYVSTAGRWLATLIFISLAVSIGGMEPGRAQEPGLAGFIHEFIGSPEDYRLERSGRRIPVGHNVRLWDQDTVSVLQPGGLMVIRLGPGGVRKLRINQKQSPLSVSYGGSEPALWGKVADELWAWVARQYSVIDAHTGPMGPEAPLAIAIPAFRDGTAEIMGGTRQFAIAWRGGRPPFTYEFFDLTRKVPLDRDTTPYRAYRSREIEFHFGYYRFVVSDSTGARVEAKVQVVAVDRFPRIPASFIGPDASGEVNDVVGASWLASQGDGAWTMEAYLRCGPWAGRSPAARALMDVLAAGLHPPQPPVE